MSSTLDIIYMTKQAAIDRGGLRDRPIGGHTLETLLCGDFDDGNGCVDHLRALDQRWQNRLTAKDFQRLGELYFGRSTALVLEFNIPARRAVQDNRPPARSDEEGVVVSDHIFLLIEPCDPIDARHGNVGNEHIVFVDVVGLSDFPDAVVPSTIRLYDGQEVKNHPGERLHYASVRWRSFARFGRHEGLTEALPSFMGGESYARRISGFCLHQPRADIIQGGAEAMKGVPNSEGDILRHRLNVDCNNLLASLTVAVVNQVVEVGFDVSLKQRFNLTNVAVGPFDL